MIRKIDDFLNSVTMYKLMEYVLLTLLGISFIEGLLNKLPYGGWQIAFSSLLVYLCCNFFNFLLARIFSVQTNLESSTITALILSLIIAPAGNLSEIYPIMMVSGFAMLSKYIFVIKRKHIFNPAAISLLIMDILGSGIAVWWIGSAALWPFAALLGFLVVRKLRRLDMFLAFFLSALMSVAIQSFKNNVPLNEMFTALFTSWPIFFFGTIMLTEPLTTPPSYLLRLVYGVVTGLLFGSSFSVGPFFSTPELALVLGNVFSFIVSPLSKIQLSLQEKNKLTKNIYEFVFLPDRRLDFHPGQYLEWTLPHKGSDTRGVRRYFSIASSPTEKVIRLIMRCQTNKMSSFKKALMDFKIGSKIMAGQLAGDFILPKNPQKKLVFIAGGIGITPYLSMIKYLKDKNEKRDIVLLYINKTKDEIIGSTIFKNSEKLGLKTYYFLTETDILSKNWRGERGHLDTQKIIRLIPDYCERFYYLSGPSGMVDNYKSILRGLGIVRCQITTDYFPGY